MSVPYRARPGFGTVTIAGNTGVTSQAGGIDIGAGTTATFINTTITGNQADGTNPDCAGKLAGGPGGHNLIGNIGTGTGTGACSGLTNAATCERAPISDKDQRGHSRNATTRGGCDIGAYDTGGAS